MSVWDDQWEDYELDKDDFEVWLDSINESGDPERDEEYYNLEMEKQNGKYSDSEWEKFLDDNIDKMYEKEIMSQAEFPEWMVKGKDYIMTVSNN
jgi:hypothetical protein